MNASIPGRHVLVVGGMRHLHAVLCRLPNVRTTLLTRKAKQVDRERHQRVEQVATDAEVAGRAALVHAIDPIHQVVSFADDEQPIAARIAADLGVAGHAVATADAVTDKYLMRDRLAAAGADDVACARVHRPEDVVAAGVRFGFPLILKPVDGIASTAVARIDSPADVSAAWERARRETGSDLVVEQFVEGPEITVEAISVDGMHRVVAITDKVKDERTFVELGGTARVCDSGDDQVVKLVSRALDALGVRFGPSHTEVILGPAGPRIVETHLRFGGDFIPEMIEDVTGIAFLEVGIRALLGQPVLEQVDAALAVPTGRRAAFWIRNSETTGILRKIVHPVLPDAPMVTFHNMLDVGATVRPPENGWDRVVLARAGTEADEDPVALVRAAAAAVDLVVEPGAQVSKVDR